MSVFYVTMKPFEMFNKALIPSVALVFEFLRDVKEVVKD